MASVGATLALSFPSPTEKTPPTTTPTTMVRFDVPAPGDRQIPAGHEIDLSGTVEGLAPDHKLFIISKTATSSYFFIVTGTGARERDSTTFAAADRDGLWRAHDGGVGSKTDKAGTQFDFTPYDADSKCAEEL